MTTPASLPADGNLKVTWVPAIADPENPTAVELNAGTAVDLTCYLTPDGFNPATDEGVIVDDRLCSRDSYEQPGRRTNTLSLMYVARHQDAAGTDNKAWTTLKADTTGFITERWGDAYDTAYAAGDVINVTPVKAGIQVESAPEANSVLKVAQKMFVTGPKRRQVAVVA